MRLKEQLGFSQSLNYRHIPAKLIGRDPDNLYSALVINKGSRAGELKLSPHTRQTYWQRPG